MKFNPLSVFFRIFNLMFYPDREWRTIAAENNHRQAVFVRFVLPFFCLIAVATIIGTWLVTSRENYSASYVAFKIADLLSSLIAGLFLSAFVITEIMAQQTGSKEQRRAFALIAYASGAAYLVIAIVELFPFFNELLVLAFYSCYLYWRGIPHLIQVDGQKQMIYGLLSFIIMALMHSLMFFLFGNLWRAILL